MYIWLILNSSKVVEIRLVTDVMVVVPGVEDYPSTSHVCPQPFIKFQDWFKFQGLDNLL